MKGHTRALDPAEFRRSCCRSQERWKDHAALEKGSPWAGPAAVEDHAALKKGAPWAESVARHFIKKRYRRFIYEPSPGKNFSPKRTERLVKSIKERACGVL